LFNSLHAFEKGIEVKCSTTLEQFIDQTKKCIIIALIGGYNNGKSFLGAKMTGKPFPQGNDLKTEGFNMLLHKYEGLPQKFIYVDSSGSGEATQMCGELTKKSNDNL
jgi:ABC-type cobalamin transport system ATPase subunit